MTHDHVVGSKALMYHGYEIWSSVMTRPWASIMMPPWTQWPKYCVLHFYKTWSLPTICNLRAKGFIPVPFSAPKLTSITIAIRDREGDGHSPVRLIEFLSSVPQLEDFSFNPRTSRRCGKPSTEVLSSKDSTNGCSTLDSTTSFFPFQGTRYSQYSPYALEHWTTLRYRNKQKRVAKHFSFSVTHSQP